MAMRIVPIYSSSMHIRVGNQARTRSPKKFPMTPCFLKPATERPDAWPVLRNDPSSLHVSEWLVCKDYPAPCAGKKWYIDTPFVFPGKTV